jgi:hypothetical protein
MFPRPGRYLFPAIGVIAACASDPDAKDGVLDTGTDSATETGMDSAIDTGNGSDTGTDSGADTGVPEPLRVRITTPRAPVDAGASLTLTGAVFDEGAPVTARWSVNGTDACESTVEDDVTTCTITVPETETANIRLVATDTDGRVGEDDLDIPVILPDRTEPLCVVLAPETGAVLPAGEPTTFEGAVADAQSAEDSLAVVWSSDRDGLLWSGNADATGRTLFATSTLTAGIHQIRIEATDPDGMRCAETIDVQVDHRPTIDIELPTTGDVMNDTETATWTVTVSDVETAAERLVVRWESDVDGRVAETIPGADSVATAEVSGLSAGAHLLRATVTDEAGWEASAEVDVYVNTTPTAPVLEIVPSAPDTRDDLVVALVSDAFDADGDALTYRYDWSVDGSASAASTSSTLPSAATSRDEEWLVTVTVTDGYATTSATSPPVRVLNAAPELDSVELVPDPIREGDTLTCASGLVTDADGDDTTVRYAWWVDGTLLAHSAESLDSDSFDRGAEVLCAATPNDGWTDGLTRYSAPVTVENTAPEIDSVVLTPAAPNAGSTLACAYVGYADPDADPEGVYHAWFVNGRATGDTTPTLTGGFVGGDLVECTVTPFDGMHAGSPRSASVRIENTPPVLSIVSLTPSSATETDTLSCTPGVTTDVDGTTAFTFAYAWTVNGASIAPTTSTLAGAWFDAGDTVACIVTPYDGTDPGSAVTSTAASIRNTPPSITAARVTPSAARVGSTLTCAGTATDVDGDVPTLSYRWSNGATTATTAVSTADAPGDVLTCTITATDASGATSTASADATVLNSAPVVTRTTVTPLSGRVGDTLTCAATATDADGDTPTIAYSWSTGATGTTYTLTASDEPGDTVTCYATAGDPEGDTSTGSASAAVTNTTPVLGAASVTPASPANDDSVACVAVATDADGDTPSLAYTWRNLRSGVAFSTGATHTLTPADASPGDTLSCLVTATDPHGASVSTTSSLTVRNRAPVATATLDPARAARTDTITCEGLASDADGDTTSLSFAWTVNGIAIAATRTDRTSAQLEDAFVAGDTLTCVVTATDAHGGTDTATATTTIGNAAPSIVSVSVTPESPRTDDLLEALVTTTDADGDSLTLTYDWYVDGALVQSGTDDTLDGTAAFERGDDVYVEVYVTDGTTTVSDTSALLTVGNTPPTVPVVTIEPSSPVEGYDDLQCALVTESSDADGDTVSYSATWDVDGTSFESAITTLFDGDTVDALDIAAGDVWTCSVTADDGYDTSDAATASTEVEAACPQLGGEGTDGTLSVSAGTTTTLSIDATVVDGSAAAGATTVPVADPTVFVEGDEVLILTMTDPTATTCASADSGAWEIAVVEAVGAGEIRVRDPITNAYDGATNSVQAVRIAQYTSVTVGAGATLTAPAWDGSTGGILAFRATTTTLATGATIHMNERGYRGGVGTTRLAAEGPFGRYAIGGGEGGTGGTSCWDCTGGLGTAGTNGAGGGGNGGGGGSSRASGGTCGGGGGGGTGTGSAAVGGGGSGTGGTGGTSGGSHHTHGGGGGGCARTVASSCTTTSLTLLVPGSGATAGAAGGCVRTGGGSDGYNACGVSSVYGAAGSAGGGVILLMTDTLTAASGATIAARGGAGGNGGPGRDADFVHSSTHEGDPGGGGGGGGRGGNGGLVVFAVGTWGSGANLLTTSVTGGSAGSGGAGGYGSCGFASRSQISGGSAGGGAGSNGGGSCSGGGGGGSSGSAGATGTVFVANSSRATATFSYTANPAGARELYGGATCAGW